MLSGDRIETVSDEARHRPLTHSLTHTHTHSLTHIERDRNTRSFQVFQTEVVILGSYQHLFLEDLY